MSKPPSQTPQAIRGTQDIFGAEAEAFAFVVETFERVRKLYRFRRVEMPVFEKTEVFSRAIGADQAGRRHRLRHRQCQRRAGQK